MPADGPADGPAGGSVTMPAPAKGARVWSEPSPFGCEYLIPRSSRNSQLLADLRERLDNPTGEV